MSDDLMQCFFKKDIFLPLKASAKCMESYFSTQQASVLSFDKRQDERLCFVLCRLIETRNQRR